MKKNIRRQFNQSSPKEVGVSGTGTVATVIKITPEDSGIFINVVADSEMDCQQIADLICLTLNSHGLYDNLD